MEEIERILNNIKIETKYLNSKQIQEVILNAKRQNKNTEKNVDFWNNITEALQKHVEIGLTKMDDQLLCATCFFTTVTLTDKQDYYLTQIKEVIDQEISLRTQCIRECLNTLQAVSLTYGMFQSSFLTTKETNPLKISELLTSTFNLLMIMGNEYSLFTFPVFKIISSFKKVVDTQFREVIFTKENQMALVNLVNHNWENPITGVRDLNRQIFQTLINVIDEYKLQMIVEEINIFYWNKAKYLMLTEIIQNSNKDILTLLYENNWVKGLIVNIHKPGLISAVTDMYFAVLGKLKSAEAWCEIFLGHIIEILNGSSSRAIENFNNYWLLTTLKKLPLLLDILIGELEKFDDTEQRLHSILFLLKQGNKIGISSTIYEEASSKTKHMLTWGIEHHTKQIRMLTFDIVCIPHNKSMPSQAKYSFILDYIQNNINYDCTVLRISMLKSFDLFMGELHIAFRNMKDNQDGLIELLNFCKGIQEIIVNSLNANGNYQRKITSIKIANILIGCLKEIPKKRRQQVRDSNVTLLEFLENRKFWILNEEQFVMKLISLLKDPSDDIRASVTELLLLHYHSELRKPKVENEYFTIILDVALQCMKSKFFYDLSCGQSMIYLIVSLLIKDKRNDTVFKSVEEVFQYGYSELLAEYKLKRDIPKTIEEGKQLHSFISILQVVLEACITNSRKIDIPNDIMIELLEVLQDVASQFSWEQNNCTSSDFSKMSDMVENIIEKSGHHSSQEKDDTKISGYHQMVLNSLWLNVKGSCQLSSVLVQYNNEDADKCSKCLMIITHVLETSRHKGAIEAAGVALGRAIQYLTSLPEDSSLSNLPQTLLKSKLQMLISEASKMASITRRGAGLSIMVHRIVSSDMRKGKPLFHYFMKTLLHTCKSTEDIPNIKDEANIENLMDLPKAILIHFLTKIVTDSSLASEMMFYSAELAELAFSNLISPQWQIRNAALQLYGALIQKLLGQKKASGTDDETITTVGCDELRTHSPKLWRYITEQLKNGDQSNKIETHSNLIPILNMLANSAKRYNFSFDLQTTSDEELLKSLTAILDSPIHTVRRLTAKCIFNIFPFQSIHESFAHMNFYSENMLHGALLLFKFCYQYYLPNGVHENEIKYLEEKFRNLLKTKTHSYWSREVFESTAISPDFDTTDLENIFLEAENNVDAPGIALWLKTNIKKCIQNCNWENMGTYISTLLNTKDYECYCEYVLDKLENGSYIPKDILTQMAKVLLSFENKYNSSGIWKMLYQISLKVQLNDVNVKELTEILNQTEITYKLRYIVPFAARVFSITHVEKQQQEVLQNIIFKLSDYEKAEFDMRYIAVLANNEVVSNLQKVPEEVKVISIKTAALLLQDEDEDIRNLSVNYYKNIEKLDIAVHPNVCLKKILNINFLQRVLHDSHIIRHLCKDILTYVSSNIHTIDEDNPFANETKNIYLEVNVLKNLIENIQLE